MDEPVPITGLGRTSGVLRSADGRLRLGWRLLSFVATATLIAVIVSAIAPAGVIGGSAALLAGATSGGWILLAAEGRKPGALGFHLSRETMPEVLRGLGLGVLVGLTVVGGIALLGGLRWSPEDGSVAGWFTGAAGALLFLALPAAAEEALLRGYPLQALAEAWGAGKALIVTSGVFGVLHLWNPGATALGTVNVAVAGLFLGVVYLRTLSLWWASGAHLGWNWAHGYLADVPVSGLDVIDAPFYSGVAVGPDWLAGGPFGPEGSLVATGVVLGVAGACWWGPWLRPGAAALATEPLAPGQIEWRSGSSDLKGRQVKTRDRGTE